MKRSISIVLCMLLILAYTVTPANFSYATGTSTAPDADNITVTNNATGTKDTVYVDGLEPKDVVKVYNAASGGKTLGTKTVSTSGSDATVTISQLGTSSGSIYVSVTSSGCTESDKTEAKYDAEPVSEPLDDDNITITNNYSKKSDTIYVSDLSAKDIVKVYSAKTGGKLLGSKTVSTSATDATVTLKLNTDGGIVYVSVTNSGYDESERVAVDYDPELTSEAPNAEDITVTNNAKGTADTVYVTNLSPNDVVKVYNKDTKGTLLGSKTVSSTGSDATVSISQIGATAGSIYVSVTSTGMNESSPRTKVDFEDEGTTSAPNAANITVTNNPKGTSDTVYVTDLTAGDIVKVYNADTGGKKLGSQTVSSSGTDATVTISQLSTSEGTIYVSLTSTGLKESDTTDVDYAAESVSTAPSASSITVTNNAAGTADTVYVTGLTASDVVKVYNAETGGTKLGSQTVATGSTDATVTISQLGTTSGSVYVSVTNSGKLESGRTQVSYSAEGTSTAPSAENILVTNNIVGTSDTVFVDELKNNDIIKVYDALSNGNLLGKTTVSSTGNSGTVTITQIGTTGGSVYVSVTSTGKAESSRTKADYSAESVSTAPNANYITVTNNATGTSDTVYVTQLSPGDVVKVYNTSIGGTALGSATVADSATETTVTITQLGTTDGVIYVTVTSTGKLESSRTTVSYSGETTSTAPSASNILVTNNVTGTPDTVYVKGLKGSDIIKVYDALTNGTLLGKITVSSTGTDGTVSIDQLGTSSGSVYVSVTSTGKKESERTEAGYSAEKATEAPDADDITVTNNASGTSDTVYVTHLSTGDTVSVYSTLIGGTALSTATVSGTVSYATVKITQLGTTGGSIYVSKTSTNKLESERTKVDYSAEAQTTAPPSSDVTVVNKYQTASTVTVTNLKENDIVKIYNSASGGTLLGTGTVDTYNTDVSISVSSLNATGGSIYVTLTSTGKTESNRTAVTYSAKASSTAPAVSDVTIVNNADLDDTITVKNLSSGTLIQVYNAASGGDLLGSATASSTKVTISIEQLGTTSGSVYISATSSGKTESSRTAVPFDAEAASDALLAGNITVVNNSGASDTISITGLTSGDIVNIYKAATGGTVIATATATGSLKTTITITQLGTSSGSIYLTVTTSGKTESSRTQKSYEAESTAPTASNVTIVNNYGISDTITVTGLTSGDVVNVYNAASSGTLLGTATVASGSTTATITVSDLGSATGKVYISVTNSGCAESSLTAVSYIAEQTTIAPSDGDVHIVNNVDIDDTITVYNLTAGDVIKVYDENEDLLGKATVATNATQASVSVDDLGSGSGSVYVTLKNKGKMESNATEVSYAAEGKTTAPSGNVYVANNVSVADTVLVRNLMATDIVKIYNAATGGDLLGSGTVASGSTEITISISQLGTSSGAVYVSITEVGKTESSRTAADYVSESKSNEAYIGNITVVNNPAGTSDTITLTELKSGDIIKVYDAATDGNLLGTATVSSTSTQATVSLTQLGTSSGSVYMTITSKGKSESDRTRVYYLSE